MRLRSIKGGLSAPSLAAALLVLLAFPSLGQELQRARCKLLYPPYAIHDTEAQSVADPYLGTWEMRMFASKAANGADSLDMGKLSFDPGFGSPPHRHLEADEWLYVLSGDGEYTYWAPDAAEPTVLAITQGSVLFNPLGHLHKVWNTGAVPLVLMAVSKSLAPYEILPDWPESPDGGQGYVPDVLPWEASCAPGHELAEGEEWPQYQDQDQAEVQYAEQWQGEVEGAQQAAGFEYAGGGGEWVQLDGAGGAEEWVHVPTGYVEGEQQGSWAAGEEGLQGQGWEQEAPAGADGEL